MHTFGLSILALTWLLLRLGFVSALIGGNGGVIENVRMAVAIYYDDHCSMSTAGDAPAPGTTFDYCMLDEKYTTPGYCHSIKKGRSFLVLHADNPGCTVSVNSTAAGNGEGKNDFRMYYGAAARVGRCEAVYNNYTTMPLRSDFDAITLSCP